MPGRCAGGRAGPSAATSRSQAPAASPRRLDARAAGSRRDAPAPSASRTAGGRPCSRSSPRQQRLLRQPDPAHRDPRAPRSAGVEVTACGPSCQIRSRRSRKGTRAGSSASRDPAAAAGPAGVGEGVGAAALLQPLGVEGIHEASQPSRPPPGPGPPGRRWGRRREPGHGAAGVMPIESRNRKSAAAVGACRDRMPAGD